MFEVLVFEEVSASTGNIWPCIRGMFRVLPIQKPQRPNEPSCDQCRAGAAILCCCAASVCKWIIYSGPPVDRRICTGTKDNCCYPFFRGPFEWSIHVWTKPWGPVDSWSAFFPRCSHGFFTRTVAQESFHPEAVGTSPVGPTGGWNIQLTSLMTPLIYVEHPCVYGVPPFEIN